MLTRIHVNQHVIKANRLHSRDDPPLTIKTSRENRKAHEVRVDGSVMIVHRPDAPLDCGARVWIETYDAVEVIR